MDSTDQENPSVFSWRFDPLESGRVEITHNGITIAETSTLANAERLRVMLDSHAALVVAARASLHVIPEQWDGIPGKGKRATSRQNDALDALRAALALVDGQAIATASAHSTTSR